jgi:hypothetical protein
MVSSAGLGLMVTCVAAVPLCWMSLSTLGFRAVARALFSSPMPSPARHQASQRCKAYMIYWQLVQSAKPAGMRLSWSGTSASRASAREMACEWCAEPCLTRRLVDQVSPKYHTPVAALAVTTATGAVGFCSSVAHCSQWRWACCNTSAITRSRWLSASCRHQGRRCTGVTTMLAGRCDTTEGGLEARRAQVQSCCLLPCNSTCSDQHNSLVKPSE